MKKKGFLSKYGNAYFFLSFWLILFTLFTLIPIAMSIVISFTNFDMVQAPRFIGVSNYIRMLLDDDIFIKAFINTLLFAVITGPIGYLLSFMVAWMINDLGKLPKTILTFLFYSPSLGGNIYLIWTYFFSDDSYGILNSVLLQLGILTDPIQWLTNPDYNVIVCIIVILWMSMGVGFLSFVAGFKQLNTAYFEAAAIDGLKNRWQELWYITLPYMRPQLLFGAIMSITSAFSVGDQITALAGYPTQGYVAHTMVLHMQDYGGTRMEMGYACAVATLLFLLMVVCNKLVQKLLHKVGD